MTTDLFTVRPEDLVDLAASLMEWEHIRYIPVEDDQGKLVGVVTYRALLRLIGRRFPAGDEEQAMVAVRDIMKSDPVTVTPSTSTVEAIRVMRKAKVGCLPVVDGDKLVGMISEGDLLDVSARLLEEYLRED